MKKQLEQQEKLPLCDVLAQYEKEHRLRLSMPGHKGGKTDTPLTQAWGHSIWQWDVTELAMTDQLYHAQGCLLEAQQLLADFLGGKQAFFLVNGASAGLMAGILSVVRPGERILIPRNAHGSIWRGVSLAGAEAVVMPVSVDDTWQIPLGVDVSQLEAVIKDYGVTAMVAIYPTYHGLYGDMDALVALCKQYGVRLLVDMAHGSHLPFLPGAIPNPIALGADIVIQGWHKTMGSMTQTAVAVVQDETLPFGKNLLYFQSTSPSYPLMASLDAVRGLWAEKGDVLGRSLAAWAEELTLAIRQLDGWRILEVVDFQLPVVGKDCTRILLANELGLSGFAVSEQLEKAGIDVEMAEATLVTMILAIGDLCQKDEIKERLVAALIQINEMQKMQKCEPPYQGGLTSFLPQQEVVALMPQPWWSLSSVRVPCRTAIGRIAAEMVSLYPPGIPLILAGEVITKAAIDLLEKLILVGGNIQGYDDGSLAVLAASDEEGVR